MKLSRSASVWKRFAWLWGAVLGAVLLPLLMEACHYLFVIYLPTPSGMRPISNPSVFLPYLLPYLATLMRASGLWGGGLGCCGAMLWAGRRSLKWRLLSIAVATGTLYSQSSNLWQYWYGLTNGSNKWENWMRSIDAATITPLLLAALLLLFFALLLRSPHPLTPQS